MNKQARAALSWAAFYGVTAVVSMLAGHSIIARGGWLTFFATAFVTTYATLTVVRVIEAFNVPPTPDAPSANEKEQTP